MFSNNMPDVEIISDNGKNLWSNLLQEVKEKSSKTANVPTSLLILGNEGSGKSSLIARLQKSDTKHGVGLEFDYIEIKDESVDENKKLNVWISSGDTYHSNLLKYALNESNFGYSFCIITISLSEPWNLIDSLEEWLNILKMHIDRLKLNSQDIQFFKESLVHQFQEYCEPDLESEKQIIVGKRRDTDFNYLHPCVSEDPEKIIVPLEDGVFENNLGIPIIVVITKTDFISTLEQDFEYNDDKFDFIQMHLRKICLKYGATLCYTSLKDDRNCDLLLNYILHRCYGFSLINTASVINKDAVFIPTGWDSLNKINILSENLSVEIRKQNYNNMISKPLSLVRANAQSRLTEPEIAEDEQVFLMKQQALIQRLKSTGPTDGNIKECSKSGSSTSQTASNRTRKTLPGQTTLSGNTSSIGTQQANEGVLANFFSSLLNKRGVSTGPPLPNQQLSGNESPRYDNTISEADEYQKDDVLSNSPASSKNNYSDSIQPALKEEREILNQGKIIETDAVNKCEITANIEFEENGNAELNVKLDQDCSFVDEKFNEYIETEDNNNDIEHIDNIVKCDNQNQDENEIQIIDKEIIENITEKEFGIISNMDCEITQLMSNSAEFPNETFIIDTKETNEVDNVNENNNNFENFIENIVNIENEEVKDIKNEQPPTYSSNDNQDIRAVSFNELNNEAESFEGNGFVETEVQRKSEIEIDDLEAVPDIENYDNPNEFVHQQDSNFSNPKTENEISSNVEDVVGQNKINFELEENDMAESNVKLHEEYLTVDVKNDDIEIDNNNNDIELVDNILKLDNNIRDEDEISSSENQIIEKETIENITEKEFGIISNMDCEITQLMADSAEFSNETFIVDTKETNEGNNVIENNNNFDKISESIVNIENEEVKDIKNEQSNANSSNDNQEISTVSFNEMKSESESFIENDVMETEFQRKIETKIDDFEAFSDNNCENQNSLEMNNDTNIECENYSIINESKIIDQEKDNE